VKKRLSMLPEEVNDDSCYGSEDDVPLDTDQENTLGDRPSIVSPTPATNTNT